MVKPSIKQEHKYCKLSFEMRYGAIDEGYVIYHKCDNPSCVNPEHLFQGTQRENMQDASKKNRLNPKSLLNFRPSKKGYRGALSKSSGEIANGL